MSHEVRAAADASLLATAWDWVLRLREEDASQEDLTRWLQWYEADDRHKQAFEEMQALWRESGRIVDGPKGLTIEQLLDGTRARSSSAQPANSIRRWAAGLTAIAASLCIAIVGWQGLQTRERSIVADAGPSVVHTARLPDGSSVELASQSKIELQYTDSERALEMERGEAHFTVAHNVHRPFIVKVGDVRVQAVGTAFNIRRTTERVVVAVTEGAVDIYGASADRRQMQRRVVAGQQLVWERDDSSPTISVITVDQALAWRQGRLQYLNEPLASVIEDVNRYAAKPIEIADQKVAQILFSGSVFTDSTDVWVEALPAVFPIDVREQSGQRVLVSREVEGD